MYQNTNASSDTPETSHPYGFSYTGTVCGGASVAHNHDFPDDAVYVAAGISCYLSLEPVRTTKECNGMVVRRFGSINYWPATGKMHITQRAGALPSEIDSLIATAKTPKQDPETWPVHPCHPGRRRIGLFRPVDERYLAEAAEVMFDDLQHAEQAQAVAIWTEGLTNA